MTLEPDSSAVSAASPPECVKRPSVDELYGAYENKVYRRTDRLFFILLGVQWLVGIVFALVISPHAWSGAISWTHPHVYAAVLLGGACSFFPFRKVPFAEWRSSTRNPSPWRKIRAWRRLTFCPSSWIWVPA